MSVAAYAAEEVTAAKDGFVGYLSDEEGTATNLHWQQITGGEELGNDARCLHITGNFYLSYIDPVVIGRQAFHSTNDFMSGAAGSLRDTVCAAVDDIFDTIADISKGVYSILLEVFVGFFNPYYRLVFRLILG